DFDETKPVNHDFNISPNEQRIIYTDKKDGQRDLWTADLHGENPVRLTDDEYDDSQPIWHPDEQRVIYNSIRNGVRQICLAFLDGRPNVQLTNNDSDSVVSDISAKGTKILYKSTKDDLDLWGVNLSNKAEFQITSDIGGEFWQDVSPNSETIVYQSAPWTSIENRLTHSLILTQKIKNDGQKITLSSDGFNPRWSPDGNQIAFLHSDGDKKNLWLTSASGGDARQLPSDGILFGGYTLLPFNLAQTQDYQWSPDSRFIIYCANREGVLNVWQTAVDGTGEKRLTDNEDKHLRFFSPLFSPDGSHLLWTGLFTDAQNKRHWSIWLSVDGKTTQIYQSDAVLQIIGWSASEDELIVKSVESGKELQLLPVDVNILQMPLKGGEPHLLSTLKEVYFQNIKLSPDHRTIAFVSRQNDGDAIQILPSTGRTAKTLISSKDVRVYFSNLTFAPDGKTIYFGKQANWQIISMIDNFK
ncbi:MAG: DPP IV N-terminal domain-containing protein, partial [Acidobacteriota bacterium]